MQEQVSTRGKRLLKADALFRLGWFVSFLAIFTPITIFSSWSSRSMDAFSFLSKLILWMGKGASFGIGSKVIPEPLSQVLAYGMLAVFLGHALLIGLMGIRCFRKPKAHLKLQGMKKALVFLTIYMVVYHIILFIHEPFPPSAGGILWCLGSYWIYKSIARQEKMSSLQEGLMDTPRKVALLKKILIAFGLLPLIMQVIPNADMYFGKDLFHFREYLRYYYIISTTLTTGLVIVVFLALVHFKSKSHRWVYWTFIVYVISLLQVILYDLILGLNRFYVMSAILALVYLGIFLVVKGHKKFKGLVGLMTIVQGILTVIYLLAARDGNIHTISFLTWMDKGQHVLRLVAMTCRHGIYPILAYLMWTDLNASYPIEDQKRQVA